MAQRHSAKRGDSGSVASSVGNGQHANEDNPNHLVYKKVSIFYHLLYYWLSDWGSQRVGQIDRKWDKYGTFSDQIFEAKYTEI